MNPATSKRARRSVLMLALFGVLAAPAYADDGCYVWSGGEWVVNPALATDQGAEHGSENTTCFADANAYGSFNNASGNSSSAFGQSNAAVNQGSNAFGSGNVSLGEAGSAFGYGNIVSGDFSSALGAANNAKGDYSSAIGTAGFADSEGSIAVAGWYDRNGNGIIDLTVDTDGDGVPEASSETAAATGTSAVAVGAGVIASGYASSAMGVGNIASGNRSSAFGYQSQALVDDSVAIGVGAVADRAFTLSVGATGAERQIVNVAAGTEAHDAVNLSQLQATLATANAYTDTAVATGGTAANAYTDNREAAIRGDMQARDAATLADANAYTDQRVGEIADRVADFDAFRGDVNRRIGLQDARIDRIGALGAAMVGMAASASAVEGSRTRLGVAAGTYNGKRALSVGLQQRLGGRAALTIGGAFSGSERSATVGFGFGL